MFVAKVQRDETGDCFVEIPETEVLRLGLSDGQTVRLDIGPPPEDRLDPECAPDHSDRHK